MQTLKKEFFKLSTERWAIKTKWLIITTQNMFTYDKNPQHITTLKNIPNFHFHSALNLQKSASSQ